MVTNSESCFAWFVFLLALCVCLGIGRWNRRGVPRADRTESERGYVGLLLPPLEHIAQVVSRSMHGVIMELARAALPSVRFGECQWLRLTSGLVLGLGLVVV